MGPRAKNNATVICHNPECSKSFATHTYEIRRGGGLFCSRACARLIALKSATAARRTVEGGDARRKAARKTEAGRRKDRARDAVRRAIQSGELVRRPCERCGALKTEAHHRDYDRPLAVKWYCRVHHIEVEREEAKRLMALLVCA